MFGFVLKLTAQVLKLCSVLFQVGGRHFLFRFSINIVK